MRIKSLSLRNFRCFCGSTTIDFAADVIAVYGRNGVGKTAIFDALELALLGEIGRFAYCDNPSVFLSNVMEDQPLTVECDAEEGNAEVSFSPDGRSSFLGGGRWTQHRDFLYNSILSDRYLPARREVAPLRELFRASLLLSQYSMRAFVEASPEERSRVLSNLLGAAYLQRCVEKAMDVGDVASRRLDQTKAVADNLIRILTELNLEFEASVQGGVALRQQLNGQLESRESLDAAIESAGLTADVKEMVPTTADTIATAVATACNRAHEQVDQQGELLSELEGLLEGHEARLAQQQQLSERLARLRTQHDQLSAKETTLQQEIDGADMDLFELDIDLPGIRHEISALEQLPSLRTQLREFQTAISNALDSRAQHGEKLASLNQGIEDLNKQKDLLAIEVDNLESVVGAESEKLHRVEVLETLLPQHESDINEVQSLGDQLADLANKIRGGETRLEVMREEAAEARERLSSEEQKQLEFQTGLMARNALISRLQAYATDQTCPLCGHQHESVDGLLKAIEAQLQSVPGHVRQAAEKVERERKELHRIEGEIHINTTQVFNYRETSEFLSKKRSECLERIEIRTAEAGELGLQMEGHAQSVELDRIRKQLNCHQEQLLKMESEQNRAATALKGALLEVRQLEATIEKADLTLSSLKERCDAVQESIGKLGLPDQNQHDDVEIAINLEKCRKQAAEMQEQKDALESTLAKLRSEIKASRSLETSVEGEISETEEHLSRVLRDIEKLRSKSRALGFPNDPLKSEIENKRNYLTETTKHLHSAEIAAERYKWSGRTAELEQKADELRQEIEKAHAELATEENKASELVSAREQAEGWLLILRTALNRLVEQRIKAHQEEIGLLFKTMIPCPYHFDGIVLTQSSGALALSVKYRDQVGKAGEPKLYLSEAQANVLALSIFLSLACRQRWSRLETVLLDDPVQHLDDLDAVAFLDTLRSAVLGRYGGRKQVIVSTCDQNLYLLMIRKFRILDSEGLRFRGISLLENGTAAPRVVYDVGGPITQIANAG